MHSLDAIDRKILSLLQSDGRITMQELADKVGLSVSPCHRRVKLLEERGVITRYIATVDQKSLGLHVSVFISIKLARQKEEDLNRFEKAISKWEEILECYCEVMRGWLPAKITFQACRGPARSAVCAERFPSTACHSPSRQF